ncbi:MAG: DUF2961 domain-containing protein [Phycisphaeraceae bacterium]|nr:MAG: DUF2961 domain-containing protein [Phycisphaeraceae bacterium]
MKTLNGALAAVIGLVGLVGVEAGAVGEPVRFGGLVREALEPSAVSRWPSPGYRCVQFSSYDRASVASSDERTWFANADAGHYLRIEENAGHGGRREWVMAEASGAGAVVRVWSPNPKGVLRVYVDGGAEPVIEGEMAGLMSGTGAVEGEGVGEPLAWSKAMGWNLYLPVPFSKGVKVTQSEGGSYYHVNVRLYEDGAVVEGWGRGGEAGRREARAGARARGEALRGWSPAEPGAEVRVAGGGSAVIFEDGAGPGAVTSLVVKGAWTAETLRRLVLVGEFDGAMTVWCPLGDFFGSPAGVSPFVDLYRVVRADGVMGSRWVMPYEKGGRLRVVNLGEEEAVIRVGVDSDRRGWDGGSMHFWAGWVGEWPIRTRRAAGTKDWNYVEVKGRGVLAGDNLHVVNPVTAWWGEGDEKIYVDGESFPSHFGTGTEDYYGYGWCSPALFNAVYASQVRCDGKKHNWGHTAVTRVRGLDAVPFRESLRFDMEVWHWAECDVAYAATVYWYAAPGAWSNRLTAEHVGAMTGLIRRGVPEAPALPPAFVIAGALECEDLKVVGKSAGLGVVVQDMEGFRARTWSNEGQLWVQGRRVGDFVELAVPAEGVGARRVVVYATRSWDYGVVRFSVNGTPAAGAAGEGVDLWCGEKREVSATGPIELGVFEPVDGRLVLRVEVVGGNERSDGTRSFFGLDCVVLGAAE